MPPDPSRSTLRRWRAWPPTPTSTPTPTQLTTPTPHPVNPGYGPWFLYGKNIRLYLNKGDIIRPKVSIRYLWRPLWPKDRIGPQYPMQKADLPNILYLQAPTSR